MARAHFVKHARKDHPEAGIKKGESYYWWKFRTGGRGGAKHYSKTAPKQSQLTQSEFLSRVYEIQERIDALTMPDSGLVDLKGEIDSIAEEIRNLGQEQEDKISNMPDSLQQGSTGELLQGRADACEEWASDLENVDLEIDRKQGESDEDFESRCDDALSEVQGVTYNGE